MSKNTRRANERHTRTSQRCNNGSKIPFWKNHFSLPDSGPRARLKETRSPFRIALDMGANFSRMPAASGRDNSARDGNRPSMKLDAMRYMRMRRRWFVHCAWH